VGDSLPEAEGTGQLRPGEEHAAAELREALVLAGSAGVIGSPVSHDRLLEMIVETAAEVIGARAALLFVVDRQRGELIYEVSVGPQGETIERQRVPMDRGLAGLVAATGQPMIVTDASEADLASEVARALGHLPRSILVVPLGYGSQITGVLELLDPVDGTAFGPAHLALLGRFASQAAIAIEQSRAHRDMRALLDELLRSDDSQSSRDSAATVLDRAGAFVDRMGADVDAREALELAGLVREIAWRGEAEFVAVRAILTGFAEYLRSRPGNGGDGGGGVGW
jgi:GAF domain-containing protein